MLVRIACKRCHLSCLWTDDPDGFLASVCNARGHCEAKLSEEGFARAPRSRARLHASDLEHGTHVPRHHARPAPHAASH